MKSIKSWSASKMAAFKADVLTGSTVISLAEKYGTNTAYVSKLKKEMGIQRNPTDLTQHIDDMSRLQFKKDVADNTSNKALKLKYKLSDRSLSLLKHELECSKPPILPWTNSQIHHYLSLRGMCATRAEIEERLGRPLPKKVTAFEKYLQAKGYAIPTVLTNISLKPIPRSSSHTHTHTVGKTQFNKSRSLEAIWGKEKFNKLVSLIQEDVTPIAEIASRYNIETAVVVILKRKIKTLNIIPSNL